MYIDHKLCIWTILQNKESAIFPVYFIFSCKTKKVHVSPNKSKKIIGQFRGRNTEGGEYIYSDLLPPPPLLRKI